MKIKRFGRVLTPEDCIDVTLYFEKNKVVKFALNYRAFIRGKWKEVYRVDNFHGFLHEQRFWRSPKPIPLHYKEHIPLNESVKEQLTELIDDFHKYRSYMETQDEKKTLKKAKSKDSG